MSLSKKLFLLITLLLVGVSSALAGCTRQSAATVRLDMAMGRVVVSPDLPVGAVIATQNWTMSGGNGISYRCWSTNTFQADIVAPNVYNLGNNIYSTNVQGIGMRFSRGGQTVNIVYPGSYTHNAGWSTSYTLEGSRFTLELIKTAPVTGSGTLAAGKYTSYDWEYGNYPILETYLSANAITLISPSCTVLSGTNMNVDIGAIKRSDLKGVGTTAGGKDFNIQLQCSGGLSEAGFARLNTTFSGNLATGTSAAQGVLINEKTGSAAAQGIGVQVLKDGSPLEFNKKYNFATLKTQETRYLTLPYRARFYQYQPTTSSGEVESHMVFNLTYD